MVCSNGSGIKYKVEYDSGVLSVSWSSTPTVTWTASVPRNYLRVQITRTVDMIADKISSMTNCSVNGVRMFSGSGPVNFLDGTDAYYKLAFNVVPSWPRVSVKKSTSPYWSLKTFSAFPHIFS